MGPIDAVVHLLNFVFPAFGVSAGAALAAKLLWRRELVAVSFGRLLAAGFAAGVLVLVAGLALLGRDGAMVTYALLVLACAVSQWWQGFGPRRR